MHHSEIFKITIWFGSYTLVFHNYLISLLSLLIIDVPISDIINCIKGEFQKSISDLTELFDTRLEKITTELLAVGLVSEYAVNSHPTSTALIKEYRAGFSFITTIVQLTERCNKFFNAMYKIRGGFSLAADTLKERINKSLMEKFNITLDL